MAEISRTPLKSRTGGAPVSASWTGIHLFIFRYCFCYFIVSATFWLLEFSGKATTFEGRSFLATFGPFDHWIAKHLFGWSTAIEPNFVHDTRYLYSLICSFLILSSLVALAWTLIGQRGDHLKLDAGLRIFLRYTLAYLMLHYGADKIFLLQFPSPGVTRLIEPLGEYSPSSLMWAFIGSSVPYTIFGGLAEIVGALLLLFRRTTLLGALITFAVMFNVTIMDFSYDVSVKVLCLNLLLIAAYLIAPSTGRLVNFFARNQAIDPIDLSPVVAMPGGRNFYRYLKVAIILYLILPLIWRDWKSAHALHAETANPSIVGVYAIQEFSIDGKLHPPLLTDVSRWRYFVVDSLKSVNIKTMDDRWTTYPILYDESTHEVRFLKRASQLENSLILCDLGSGHFAVGGSLDGNKLEITMTKVDRSSFPLVNRGFHWINESSFIR